MIVTQHAIGDCPSSGLNAVCKQLASCFNGSRPAHPQRVERLKQATEGIPEQRENSMRASLDRFIKRANDCKQCEVGRATCAFCTMQQRHRHFPLPKTPLTTHAGPKIAEIDLLGSLMSILMPVPKLANCSSTASTAPTPANRVDNIVNAGCAKNREKKNRKKRA
jgi:hypothetical protein